MLSRNHVSCRHPPIFVKQYPVKKSHRLPSPLDEGTEESCTYSCSPLQLHVRNADPQWCTSVRPTTPTVHTCTPSCSGLLSDVSHYFFPEHFCCIYCCSHLRSEQSLGLPSHCTCNAYSCRIDLPSLASNSRQASHRPAQSLASHLNRQSPGTGVCCGLLWPSKPDTIIVGLLVPASSCLLDAESVTPCTHLCNLKHIGIWVAEEYGRPAAHGLGELHSGLLQASHEGLNGLHTCSMPTSAQSMRRGAGAGRGKNKC